MKAIFADVLFDGISLLLNVNNNKSVELSATEARAFACLFEEPNQLKTKDILEQKIWQGRPVSESSLSVLILKLRMKLKTVSMLLLVKNIPREGYKGLVMESETGPKLNSEEREATILMNQNENSPTSINTFFSDSNNVVVFLLSVLTLITTLMSIKVFFL
ncbi:TPA: winged helix-turn-helix domain-containing protein [Vibrio parahaemolyticus]